MGNSQDKHALRKSHSVPDTQSLPPDAPVLYKEKSRSSQRLYQPNKGSKQSKKKSKQQKEAQAEFQLPPSEAAFLPAFPLRGDLEDLDFEVIEVIAKGAYGNVVKVQREDDKRFYATKILSKGQILQEGAVRQCKDEAAIQSMAGEHPFVVKAYEYWQSQRNLYLVLEYVPHGDMFTLWTFHGAFPEDLVRLYIAEMAMVLEYLHSECVIYRDIKMENILFDAYGHIQLTDFGLAKWLQSGDTTRTVCGTLQYMAPEVLSVYPYSHPADWWSIGILMYTMLAGSYPVDGMETHTKMAQKVFECDYFLPGEISDSAQDVINKVLTKSPHKRLCDLYHLQDLYFFQDLIFSDLTDGKINPVDVVPPDFFPMTGTSWAPRTYTKESDRHFDQFDGTNTNYDMDPRSSYNSQRPVYNRHRHRHQRGEPRGQQTHFDDRSNGHDSSHHQRQSAETPSVSSYNHNDLSQSSLSGRRDSSQITHNSENDRIGRDRFGSFDSSLNFSERQSSTRRSERQLTDRDSYNQDLHNLENHQSPTAYYNPPNHHENGGSNIVRDERDSRKVIGQRKGSRDLPSIPLGEQNIRPPHTGYSSRPPALPLNPPPATLTSQTVSLSSSKQGNVFKMVEPMQTVTLPTKSPTIRANNFSTDGYTDNQVGPRVVPPLSATLVTSPTFQFPPSSSKMTGLTQGEKAEIQLPTSPIVQIPAARPQPSQPNQYNPPQPPPQSHKPTNFGSSNQFNLPQPPPQSNKPVNAPIQSPPQPPPQANKPVLFVAPSQYRPPQPPPQTSKPTVTSKPVVAPKPAVRKSFNTKKAYKPPVSDVTAHPGIKPSSVLVNNNSIPLSQAPKLQGLPPSSNYNDNDNTNNLHSQPVPSGNPRPVPRPRQTVRKSNEASADRSEQDVLTSPVTPDRDEDDKQQDPEARNSFHWNLPTSAVPSYV